MATDPRAAYYDVGQYGTDSTYEQKAAFNKATAAMSPEERENLSRFFAMQHQRGAEASGQTMDPGVRAIDTTPDEDTFAAVASGTARSGERDPRYQEGDKKQEAVRAWLDTPEAKRFLGPPVGPAAMGPMGPPPGGPPGGPSGGPPGGPPGGRLPQPNYGPPGTLSPGGPPGGPSGGPPGGRLPMPNYGPPGTVPWGGGPPGTGLPPGPPADPRRAAMLEQLFAAGAANPDWARGGNAYSGRLGMQHPGIFRGSGDASFMGRWPERRIGGPPNTQRNYPGGAAWQASMDPYNEYAGHGSTFSAPRR